jgi:hypothetical protein
MKELSYLSPGSPTAEAHLQISFVPDHLLGCLRELILEAGSHLRDFEPLQLLCLTGNLWLLFRLRNLPFVFISV